MTDDPLFAVWVQTEGLDISPILCTTGQTGTELVEALSDHRIISHGAIVPCCRNRDHACVRDVFDDKEPEIARAIQIVLEAAIARSIPWPADQGRLEPEERAS